MPEEKPYVSLKKSGECYIKKEKKKDLTGKRCKHQVVDTYTHSTPLEEKVGHSPYILGRVRDNSSVTQAYNAI